MAFKARQHRFSMAPQVSIQRSGFDRSFTHTTTFDAGYLIPFYVDEVLPGDTFKCNCSLFARMLTPIVPFMDNVYLDTHFFFVPYRLLWDHWVNMHGEQAKPDDSIDYVVPKVLFPYKGQVIGSTSISADVTAAVGSIYDYLGIPTGKTGFAISALPLRAYNKIWNEWFRDENIQDSVREYTNDNDVTASAFTLLRRGKRHDYFTSCLPWPQKGPGVDLPIGDYAPVVYGQTAYSPVVVSGNTFTSITEDSTFNKAGVRVRTGASDNYNNYWEINQSSEGGVQLGAKKMYALYTDLGEATAININKLRQAFQIQRLLEASARGGTRYAELLQSIFGVTNPDARLQRSEYLGGGSTRLSVYQVPQTASTDSTSPQGNLAAFATASDSRHAFTKSFTEFGVILGLVSVRADLHYQQGLNRMWSRSSRYDFYYPQLAHLGEQAVLNKEIYLQGGTAGTPGAVADDQVFGYQERWAEYRYQPSLITGKLRSTAAQSLDYWHLAQEFDSLPTLSPSFIQENPPITRVVAVQDEPQFKLDSLISLQCYRPMPLYSIPGLIDHF